MVLATRHGFIQGVLLEFVRCDIHADGLQQHTHGWISYRVECVEEAGEDIMLRQRCVRLTPTIISDGSVTYGAPPNFVVHRPQWRSLQRQTHVKISFSTGTGMLGFSRALMPECCYGQGKVWAGNQTTTKNAKDRSRTWVFSIFFLNSRHRLLQVCSEHAA